MRTKSQKPAIDSVETVAKSALFTIEKVDLTFGNGQKRIYERMKPSLHQAVMIIPVLDDNLLLVKEYAVAIEDYELGFPKGGVELDEDILTAANRELMEEIGYGAKKFTILTQLTTMPSHFSNLITLILAEELYAEKHEGDEPEPLTLVKWPINKLMDLLKRPDFREARNVSALFLTREFFAHREEYEK